MMTSQRVAVDMHGVSTLLYIVFAIVSFCNLYFQMQNWKDYFGYVHACEMFRMLISTKSYWVWKKVMSVTKKKKCFFLFVFFAMCSCYVISLLIHCIYRALLHTQICCTWQEHYSPLFLGYFFTFASDIYKTAQNLPKYSFIH